MLSDFTFVWIIVDKGTAISAISSLVSIFCMVNLIKKKLYKNKYYDTDFSLNVENLLESNVNLNSGGKVFINPEFDLVIYTSILFEAIFDFGLSAAIQLSFLNNRMLETGDTLCTIQGFSFQFFYFGTTLYAGVLGLALYTQEILAQTDKKGKPHYLYKNAKKKYFILCYMGLF